MRTRPVAFVPPLSMACTAAHLALHRQRRPASGFTLLEAILACAALCLGLLALAQLQTALQASLEVARERGEAVRLAQDALERPRIFSVPDEAAGGRATAFGQVRPFEEAVSLGTGRARVARLRLDVIDLPTLHHHAARASVNWQDRHGRPQSVRLDTLIATVPP